MKEEVKADKGPFSCAQDRCNPLMEIPRESRLSVWLYP